MERFAKQRAAKFGRINDWASDEESGEEPATPAQSLGGGRIGRLAEMHRQMAEQDQPVRAAEPTELEVRRSAGLPPPRDFYSGYKHYGDSILGLYLGTFRKPTTACEFYIYELPSVGGLKIGIDSTGKRASQSKGIYGDKLVSFNGLRRDMWLLEQTILRALPGDPLHPGLLEVPLGWAGYTEIRFGDPVELIVLAAARRPELEEAGWVEFACKHICIDEDERAMCRVVSSEATSAVAQGESGGDQQLKLL